MTLLDRGDCVVVRHAAVRATPARPRRGWELTTRGREDARALGARMQAHGIRNRMIASSDEVKALQTAEEIAPFVAARRIRTEPALGEVTRPWIAEGYRTRAEAYLRGEPDASWEPRTAVVERLAAAVESLLRETASPIIVGHGLAFSLWVGSWVRDVDVVEFWAGLTYPDAVLASPSRGRVARLAG